MGEGWGIEMMSDVGTEDRFPAAFEEPAQALLFKLVFGDHILPIEF